MGNCGIKPELGKENINMESIRTLATDHFDTISDGNLDNMPAKKIDNTFL